MAYAVPPAENRKSRAVPDILISRSHDHDPSGLVALPPFLLGYALPLDTAKGAIHRRRHVPSSMAGAWLSGVDPEQP